MTLRLAFVIDKFTGQLRYTMEPEQSQRVNIAKDELCIISSEFDTPHPSVYYDFGLQKLVPMKRIPYRLEGDILEELPKGALIGVGENVIEVDYDGEPVQTTGPKGAVRHVSIRCVNYLPALIAVTCEGNE